jgi:hypothetical protein
MAHLILRNRREELEVYLNGCATQTLKAPVLGSMEGRDAESLGGTIDVTLRHLRGGEAVVAYRGTGGQAGIEIMDEADELGAVRCGEAELVRDRDSLTDVRVRLDGSQEEVRKIGT